MDQISICFIRNKQFSLIEVEELAEMKNNRSLFMIYKDSCELAFSTMANLKTLKRGMLKMLDDEMQVYSKIVFFTSSCCIPLKS